MQPVKGKKTQKEKKKKITRWDQLFQSGPHLIRNYPPKSIQEEKREKNKKKCMKIEKETS